MNRIPYLDQIRDHQLERIRSQKQTVEVNKKVDEDKFGPVWMYEFVDSDKGEYVDVYDGFTGEFLFRDDSSFAAKEYIRQNQRVSA